MTRGAVVGLAAFAVMAWLNRRPQSWWEGRPRPERPVPPDQHRTPTQVRTPIRGTLLRPGRELDRGDRW